MEVKSGKETGTGNMESCSPYSERVAGFNPQGVFFLYCV